MGELRQLPEKCCSVPAPVIRQFTRVAGAAVGVVINATDVETGQLSVVMMQSNQILDALNDVLTAGDTFTIAIIKNGQDTGRRLYSTSLNPASAGRIAVGPIDLSPGSYQFRVTVTAVAGGGVNAAYAFIIKFARSIA